MHEWRPSCATAETFLLTCQMPVPHPAPSLSNPRPTKKPRLNSSIHEVLPKGLNGSNHVSPFTSVPTIRAALHTQSDSLLPSNIVAIRDHITPKTDEVVGAGDARIALVLEWLASGCLQDVEHLWDQTHIKSALFIPLLSLLAAIFHLLRPYSHQHTSLTAVSTFLLSDRHAERLNRAARSEDASLVMASMKLWVELASFDDWQAQVAAAWQWGGKAGPKLLAMRRRGKLNMSDNPFRKPDIRTLYTLFLLSFLSSTTPPSLKQSFLTQKDTFTSLFKDIRRDHCEVVRKILETCWEGVWEDRRLRKTVKIGVFGEWVLAQILKLYERSSLEASSHLYSPADLAHHFLLAICTRPGVGVCFKDAGWYPREAEIDADDEIDQGQDMEQHRPGRGRVYNKILGNILKSLKVGEDARHQELALKILQACPELVLGFWSSVSLSLEPRLSSRWLSNVAFFNRVVSLPVPSSCFRLAAISQGLLDSGTAFYRPNPPPLSTLLANTLPPTLNKVYFSKGLLSKAGLVRLFSAQMLTHCLNKFERVRQAMRTIHQDLGEQVDDGLWSKRLKELEREIRRRVPDFSVIVSFSQQKMGDQVDNLERKRPLLREAALRLMLCWQRSLADVVAEARFDVGKLLMGGEVVAGGGPDMATETDALIGVEIGGFDILSRLHVLRLLHASDQFSWSSKAGTSGSSYLYHILLVHVKATQPIIRNASHELLSHLLSGSVLFEHDPSELDIWIDSLPRMTRDSSSTDPDGNPLTDEASSVLGFLDDCLQRCLKNPYHYLEDIVTLLTEEHGPLSNPTAQPQKLPSPLLMAMFEQLLSWRRDSESLSHSDILALASYLRKILLGLIGKLSDLSCARRLIEKFARCLNGGHEPVSSRTGESMLSSQNAAIRRELTLLYGCLEVLDNASPVPVPEVNPNVQTFLTEMETASIGEIQSTRAMASKLVDWLRFVDQPLHPSEILRLVRLIDQWSPDGVEVEELLGMLNPTTENIWSAIPLEQMLVICSRTQALSMTTACLHADSSCFGKQNIPASFAELAVSLASSGGRMLRTIGLVLHHMDSIARQVKTKSSQMDCFINILAALLRTWKSSPEVHAVKSVLFVQNVVTANLLLNNESFSEAVVNFVKSAFEPNDQSDIEMASVFCEKAVKDLRSCLSVGASGNLRHLLHRVQCWSSCARPVETIELLDCILDGISTGHMDRISCGTYIFDIIRTCFQSQTEHTLMSLQKRTPRLLDLWISFNDMQLRTQIAPIFHLGLLVGYNGCLPSDSTFSVAGLARTVQSRWDTTMVAGQSDSIAFPQEASLLPTEAVMISPLFYKSRSCRSAFLRSLHPLSLSSEAHPDLGSLAQSAHAMLEAVSLVPGHLKMSADATATLNMVDFLVPQFVNAVIKSTEPSEVRHHCFASLIHIAEFGTTRHIVESTRDCLATVSVLSFNNESLKFFNWAMSCKPTDFTECTAEFVGCVLRWLVRRFSEDEVDTAELLNNIDMFGRLIEQVDVLQRHLVEPVLVAIIQARLNAPSAIQLACILASKVVFQEDAVLRQLLAIFQHPHFSRVCSPTSLSRNPLIRLIETLFMCSPQSALQADVIRPLVAAYGGSLSVSDRKLLGLFRLFEKHASVPIAVILTQRRGATDQPLDRPFQMLLGLDSARLFKTCGTFPLHEDLGGKPLDDCPELYDPEYILSLYGNVLTTRHPSGLEWVHIGRTNVMGLAICALASRKGAVRQTGLTLVIATWKAIQETPFQERDQLSYNLQLLRNTIISDAVPSRLPMFTVLFLAHTIQALFHPTVLLFPHVSRFLLQRPVFDLQDVPLLYGMLYSSSDEWKKERLWIIRFIGNAMKTTADWRVMRRRRTWDLLASLFQAEEGDRQLRHAVFDVLASLTCHQHATHSLLLRSSLFSWIEIQLLTLKPHESLYWLRLVENIAIVIDAEKVEHASHGAWRSELARCLRRVLRFDGGATSRLYLEMVSIGSRILLRTVGMATPPLPDLAGLVAFYTEELTKLEPKLTDVTVPQQAVMSSDLVLHRAVSTPIDELTSDGIGHLWASCVRTLWTVGMHCELPARRTAAWWGALTCRLVGMGEAGGEAGDWARKEALRNIVGQE